MNILAIDTATQSCSVALVHAGHLLAEMTTARHQTHSRHIMNMVDAVIQSSGLKIADVDAFTVTQGPGSFTGLRIGISTAKGLAMAAQKPIIGVSTLEVLARQCLPANHLICAAVDARKKEVYSACYQYTDGRLNAKTPEQAFSPAAAFSSIDKPCIMVGSGVVLYKKYIEDILGDLAIFALDHVIHARSVALIAMERFQKGKQDDLSDFVPVYLRKSDAELNLGKGK